MKIALLLSILIFIVCVAFFVKGYIDKTEISKLGSTYSASSSSESKQEAVKVDVPVDFKELKKVNGDIYAWINIPNTPVDYPILRNENNAFYLNRNVEKKYSVYGSIYTEDYNSKDFLDFNTLIYGHNMKNGTMFGSLKKFRGAKFFEENRYINIYMENRILKYEIFAACTWDNKHILASRNFETAENRTAYLEDIMSVRDMNSQFKKDISVTADDKIITLSTCMNNKNKRFIVSGVLIYDSQNPSN